MPRPFHLARLPQTVLLTFLSLISWGLALGVTCFAENASYLTLGYPTTPSPSSAVAFMAVPPPLSQSKMATPWWQEAVSLLPPTPMVTPPLPASPASSTSYLSQWLPYTREPELLRTLEAMQQHPIARKSVRLIQEKQIKLVFKNMATLGPQYLSYDALAWMNKTNDVIIIVNEQHRTAPTEALVALISHEALHNDRHNSLQEEVVAWNIEAKVWRSYLTQHPELARINTPLVKRLNTLAKHQTQGTVHTLVHQHPNYQHLPAVSPGFEVATLPIARPNKAEKATPTAPPPIAEVLGSKPTIPNPLTLSVYPDTLITARPIQAFPFAQVRSVEVSRRQLPESSLSSTQQTPTPTTTLASKQQRLPNVARPQLQARVGHARLGLSGSSTGSVAYAKPSPQQWALAKERLNQLASR